jgi:crotonobetainyl-CoA:carnitine CoA-transferase CaiB-like acyl-CoA transferase
MNLYYRCFETSDGFVAVACLNVAQRKAFLELFDLDDATIDAPDLVRSKPSGLAAKKELTARIAASFALRSTDEWIGALESAGVPCGRVQQRETVYADPQVVAERLVGRIDQQGLGSLQLLAPFIRVGGEVRGASPAPSLGAHTDAVLGELS